MSTRRIAYRIEIYEAQMAAEKGTRLSLTSWGANTDRYKATEVEITVEITGASVAEDVCGTLQIYPDADSEAPRGMRCQDGEGRWRTAPRWLHASQGLTLDEAIACGLARVTG